MYVPRAKFKRANPYKRCWWCASPFEWDEVVYVFSSVHPAAILHGECWVMMNEGYRQAKPWRVDDWYTCQVKNGKMHRGSVENYVTWLKIMEHNSERTTG